MRRIFKRLKSYIIGNTMTRAKKEKRKTKRSTAPRSRSSPRKKSPSLHHPRKKTPEYDPLYRALAEQSLEGIAVVTGPSPRILYANPAMAELSGYTIGELKKLSPSKIEASIHPDDRALFFQRFRARLAGKPVPSRYEFRLVRKNGEIRWLRISAVKIEYKKQPAVQAVFMDITDLKRAEEVLRQEQKRFRDVAENIREWVWEVDGRGKYSYSSPVVEEILGYKPEEILKKRFYDFFHPIDRQKLKKVAFKIFAQKKPFRRFINRNLRKDGREVWLSTSGIPLIDEKGKVIGYRGADIDISERREAEEKLRKYREKLEKMVKKRTDELEKINKELLREISRRKKKEKALRASRRKLGEEKEKLERKNIALREILEQIDVEKKRCQEEAMAGIEKLVLPVLRRFRMGASYADERKYLKVLEGNIKEITSTFSREILEHGLKLSPREIEICDLIKSGLSSKEIARTIGLSVKTVERHRDNIRNKLNLKNKKINLTSYLQSL